MESVEHVKDLKKVHQCRFNTVIDAGTFKYAHLQFVRNISRMSLELRHCLRQS